MASGRLFAPLVLNAQVQPGRGIYSVSNYVTAASSGCPQKVGEHQTSFLYYPGPNARGARYVGAGTRTNPFVVGIDTYPTTPPAGVTTWSGSFTYSAAPGGVLGTGTFTAQFTFLDPDFFVGKETDVFTNCTVTVQATLIRVGR